jgi:SAM-dependent methyltransferase
MILSPIQQAVERRVRALELPAGARILDAPCGAGDLAAALRARGYDAWGADIDLSAAGRLGGSFRQADLTQRLPWPDGSFDAALSVEGIEHLENPYAHLRELHRVLRPGGTLILTTPNIGSARSRVRFFGSSFFHHDPRPLRESARDPLHHIALMTFAGLRYALHTSGFRLVEAGHTHIKAASYLYVWMAPVAWIYTRVAFRKERDPAQREANADVRRALGSRSLQLGENLLLVATRV